MNSFILNTSILLKLIFSKQNVFSTSSDSSALVRFVFDCFKVCYMDTNIDFYSRFIVCVFLQTLIVVGCILQYTSSLMVCISPNKTREYNTNKLFMIHAYNYNTCYRLFIGLHNITANIASTNVTYLYILLENILQPVENNYLLFSLFCYCTCVGGN